MVTPKQSAPLDLPISPLSIARMLWKRKLWVVLVWIAVTVAAAAVVWKLPTLYTAESVILVDSQKIPEKFVASTVNSDLQDRIATISQQILSSTRLKRIIDDFDLYRAERKTKVQEEILELMRKDIAIKLEKGWTNNRPGAFRVGYIGPDPAIVAQVANRITNAFIEENLKTREVQAEGTSEFIDAQLQAAKKRLDELEAAVSEYKRQHNGELPQQENALSGALARLELDVQANREAITRLTETKATLENTLGMAEATYATLSKATAQPEPASPVAAASPALDTRPRQEKASAVLEAQLAQLRIRYSDDHPDIRRLKADIARLKSLEAADAAAPAPGAQAQVATAQPQTAPGLQRGSRDSFELGQSRERVSALQASIVSSNRELEVRKSEHQRLQREINGLQQRLSNLPIREQEMAQITRDYEISKANYKSLLDKKLTAEMATDMERRQKSERFTVLDPARVPEKPFKPNRPLLSGLGSLIGLGLGLAIAAALELRSGVLLGEWELPRGTVVLGRLPLIDMSREQRGPGRFQSLLRSNKRVALAGSLALLGIAGLIVTAAYLVWGGL